MSTPPRRNTPRRPPGAPRRRRRPRRDDESKQGDDESKESKEGDETKEDPDPRTFLGKLGDADVKSRRTNPDQKGNDKGPLPLLVTPSLLLF